MTLDVLIPSVDTGCFVLGFTAGAILGAAAALWRVRTARTGPRASHAPDASAAHRRGVAKVGRR